VIINLDRGFSVGWEKVKNAIEAFRISYAEHGHHFELVWSLWFFLRCGVKVSSSTVMALNSTSNGFGDLAIVGTGKKRTFG